MQLVSTDDVTKDEGNRFERVCPILKVEQADGNIVYGVAIVSTKNGEPYFDKQGDHIPVDNMEAIATKFMQNCRKMKAMHEGKVVGEFVHSFVLTNKRCAAMPGVVKSDNEMWLIGVAVHDKDVLAKFHSGEFNHFSIGGKGRRTKVP